MHSDKQTIEDAVKDFEFIKSFKPYKFSGKWFVVKVPDGFTAYRTKQAASNNAVTTDCWSLTL